MLRSSLARTAFALPAVFLLALAATSARGAGFFYPPLDTTVDCGSQVQFGYSATGQKGNGDLLQPAACSVTLYDTLTPVEEVAFDGVWNGDEFAMMEDDLDPSDYPGDFGGNKTFTIDVTLVYDPGTAEFYEDDHYRNVTCSCD